ncbi:hypothetical protein CDL15_Pgr002504 [Punica granatum]|nr:hypothetical protein CDL15_Pgr002504 [Punica granatum]PKI55881.1 hypothetical protein CRG98_023762 [Punica granatum]
MAKLSMTLLIALFGVMLVSAMAHKTTITTVEVVEDEEVENQRRGCQKQLQSTQMLRHCQDFLMDVSRGVSRSQCGCEGSSQFDPAGPVMRGRTSDHFEPCCNQLRQMDQRCMCEGLRQIVRQEQGRFGGWEVQQVAQCARQLPQMCGTGQTCSQIRAVYI